MTMNQLGITQDIPLKNTVLQMTMHALQKKKN